MSLESEFEEAAANFAEFSSTRKSKNYLSDEQKLQLYGLYKQAVQGDCLLEASWLSYVKSWWDRVEAKKLAWLQYKGQSTEQVQQLYIQYVKDILPVGFKSSKAKEVSMIKRNDEEMVESELLTCVVLLKADYYSDQKLQQLIKDLKIDVKSLRDENGASLLHHAADVDNLTAVKYMVEQLKMDTQCKDSEGETALDYAVTCEHEEIAKYLKQYI